MGEIRNCIKCGKIFNYMGKSVCPRCIEEEEVQFRKVKEYIEDNPKSNIQEVSDATEVPVEKILKFLREERLEIICESPNLALECERCGVAIKTGRFCVDCKGELENSFKKEFGLDKKGYAADNAKKSGADKMYTATRRKGEV